MIKIVLTTPILQHYRLSFYEKLSSFNPEFDLHVLHGIKKSEDGRPSYEGDTNFNHTGFVEHKYKLPFEIVYNKGMFSTVKRINPDVVIVQGIAGDLSNRRILKWAQRNNKKVLIWACAWEPGRIKGVLMKLKNILVKSYYKKANSYLAYSKYASNYIKGLELNNEAPINVSYNGIEIDGMIANSEEILKKSIKVRDELNLNGFVTFLYVGGLIKEKKIDLLVNAFVHLKTKHSNIKLLIIGDGPERGMLESLLNKFKDKDITYLGRIYDGVDPYFAASDCLVLPGSGGLALNQAMFWGKPCIASVADGTEDDLVIEGETGYRFLNDDLDSLVMALERRILESDEKIKSFSEKSIEIIKTKSNVTNMVKVFGQAIESLI